MRIDDDFADLPSVLQPHVLPGLAAIDRLVHAIPEGNVAANARFARAHVDDVRVRRRHRNAANRRNRLLVKQRHPVHAAISGLPHSARHSAKIIRCRIAWDACDRQHPATPERADLAVFHPLEQALLKLLGGSRRPKQRRGRSHRQYDNEPVCLSHSTILPIKDETPILLSEAGKGKGKQFSISLSPCGRGAGDRGRRSQRETGRDSSLPRLRERGLSLVSDGGPHRQREAGRDSSPSPLAGEG